MDADHWQRAHDVFEAAVARSPDERTVLLDEQCAGDAEVRAEVESLLAHDEQAPAGFMRPRESGDPVTDQPPCEDPARRIGRKIGQYTVRGIIATGGMGDVYLAEQNHPQREVALKMMRVGATSRSGMRRFDYESQALARLKHPHIAQIYEAGTHEEITPDGLVRVPYFAMEYIDGGKHVTEYAREHALSTRKRLELFAHACDAVHHGHQKGIIHRDLKPANILVDAAGRVKVIDFGIARSTDADVAVTTLRTAVGELVGTLQYMSPEQCDADPQEIDTRSDVYSLGVVLYELLTGELPYDASRTTIYRAIQIIKEQAPNSPATVNAKLRGDVEMIVLKALKKDRDDRYSSAGDLAADVRRFLRGAPIEARPPTAWWKVQRWVGKHPLATTSATCVFIACAILLGTVVAVWLARDRPHQLVVTSGKEVQLQSIGGNVLRTWRTEQAGCIPFAHPRLIERPKDLGGGRLALLGFQKSPDLDHPDSLVAYDVDVSLTNPVWTRCIEDGDAFPDPHQRGYRASQFGIAVGAVFDIFPESPGPEIVAVHLVRMYSQCIIRIYDLRGEVLYEVWHDGVLDACRWMSNAGLLVFSGSNDERRWDELGFPGFDIAHPMVVFAVRPKRGVVRHDFLTTTPGDDDLNPAWYLCALPPGGGGVRVEPPWMGNPKCAVRVEMYPQDGRNAACFWDLDEDGLEVPDSRDTSDSYKLHVNELPDCSVYKLVPFDSILEPAPSSVP